MSRKWKWTLVTLAVAIIATLSIGITVSADEPDGTTADGWYCEPGFAGGYRGFGGYGTADVTELLGLTAEEYQALRAEGQSMAQIAAAQGVSEDELIAAMLAPRAEMLAERVAEGYLTQEQADLMLAQMQEQIAESIQRTEVGPTGDRGNFGGRGGFMSGRGFARGGCGGFAATESYGAAGTVAPRGGMMGTW